MTYEEAFVIVTRYDCDRSDCQNIGIKCSDCKEAYKMVKEACERQTAKKHIIVISHNGLKELHCYSCNAMHGVYGDVRIPTTSKYCPFCGQAIDWSGEDDA